MRALAGAIVLGSSAGLVIGAGYLASSGGKPAPRPVPTASGPLQARAVPAARSGGAGPAALPIAAAASTRDARHPDLALRDRFRVAAQALGAAAQPFRFQRVAEAPSDLHCLTEAVYFEARGEAPEGQQAVAQVVLNRVRHPAFPKTICGVVHQHTGSGCQFSFACNPAIQTQAAVNNVAWRRAETIASSELHGAVMRAVGDATHFQAARSSPFAGLLKVAQIGAHIFYRFGGHAGAPAMFHQTPGASSEPARMEVAHLDELDPDRITAPASGGGRIRVTLYPSSATLPTASVRSDIAALKPVALTSPDPKPVARLVPAAPVMPPPASPPTPTRAAPADKGAVISVALAQS